MGTAQSPPVSDLKTQRPVSGRKALQPTNAPVIISSLVKKPKLNGCYSDLNKENLNPCLTGLMKSPAKQQPKAEADVVESFDSSLAEELSAIRKKLERLKIDKDSTERLLRERDSTLDMHMNQLETRGEAQKQLEIQVDRLFRMKELQLSCMRISPIRSLRDKEGEKKRKEDGIVRN